MAPGRTAPGTRGSEPQGARLRDASRKRSRGRKQEAAGLFFFFFFGSTRFSAGLAAAGHAARGPGSDGVGSLADLEWSLPPACSRWQLRGVLGSCSPPLPRVRGEWGAGPGPLGSAARSLGSAAQQLRGHGGGGEHHVEPSAPAAQGPVSSGARAGTVRTRDSGFIEMGVYWLEFLRC